MENHEYFSQTFAYLGKSSTFAVAFVIFTVVNRKALAIVAQLVEQRIRNAWVAGSSPASGSRIANHHSVVRFFFCIIKKKVLPLQAK